MVEHELGLHLINLAYSAMPSTSRRSPNATLVTKPAIDEAAEALESLPEKTKEKLSLREAVDVLRDQITAALDKGYSYEDIAAMLEKQDISIAPSSLKHYLARSNRQLKQEAGTQTRRKRTVTKSAEAEPEALPELTSVSEPAPKRRGRPPASEAKPAADKTRSTAARTKSVPTAPGTRKRRSKA
jgi:hypothetical protein